MITGQDLGQKLYTPQEVAELLKVGYYSIYNKIASGQIEAYQVGRKWVVPHQSILNYLNNRSNLNKKK